MCSLGVSALAACLAAGLAVAAQRTFNLSASIQTTPERTAFRETSRYADVVNFLEALAKARPAVHLTTFGTTVEGRALPLAVIGASEATPDAVRRTGKLRVYIQGNIHGGEVEGKESAQMLLRDLAEDGNAGLLESMVLLVAPIYNADGNERFALDNRGRQYGPLGGQGQRANAQGLDLNRDHMKLDSPEARAFVTLMTDYDPHVTMDLHTTNGTRHAYHLTYAPPLNPATHPDIVRLLRTDWLPSVTASIKEKYGWDFYYYGNVEGGSSERAWRSFDHRPRFNNNYIGLRNRFAVLSEAYAYASFRERVLATSRFVDETLTYLSAHAGRIRAIADASDRERIVGGKLPLRGRLERSAESVEILMGAVTQMKHPVDGHIMDVRQDVRVPERMPEYGTFEGTDVERVPSAYFVPAYLTEAIDRLRTHGITMRALSEPAEMALEEFHIQRTVAAERPFQGRRERTLTGSWVAATREVQAGTLRVDMNQPLARLAFYLIEPRSDDGLANWDLLGAAPGEARVYPISRSVR
jgi:hypothetical protein